MLNLMLNLMIVTKRHTVLFLYGENLMPENVKLARMVKAVACKAIFFGSSNLSLHSKFILRLMAVTNSEVATYQFLSGTNTSFQSECTLI